jgi:hypothetical protein
VALLLISGLPGAGKSCYCRWLAEEHNYVHWGTDAKWDEWRQLISVRPNLASATAICNAVRRLGTNVAVEWGYSPGNLPLVKLLGQTGFELWWFAGDEEAARQSWLLRPVVLDQVLFDTQMAAIHKAWPSIEAAYPGRVLETVTPGPIYMDNAEIYRQMFRPPA